MCIRIYIYIYIHCCGISVKSKDTFHLMSSIAWLCKHITHQIKASKQCKANAEFVCQLNQLNWMKVSVDHIISQIGLLRSTVVPSFRSSKWHGIPWHRCNCSNVFQHPCCLVYASFVLLREESTCLLFYRISIPIRETIPNASMSQFSRGLYPACSLGFSALGVAGGWWVLPCHQSWEHLCVPFQEASGAQGSFHQLWQLWLRGFMWQRMGNW